VPKVLLTQVNMTVPDEMRHTLGVKAVATCPVRQAELLQCVVSTLNATRRAARMISNPASGLPDGQPGHGTGQAPASQAALPAYTTVPGSLESRIDVLVAEDNPVNQLVMGQILDMSGLTYQIVADGVLAVDAFRQMRPRLVLMDISMPRLNGIQATAAIRSMIDLGGDAVPIIGVTAHAQDNDRDACLRCGMNDHIAKPISPDMLLGRIARWLPRPARAQA
jgi:CheY-like chemotaxis protein